MANRLRYTSPVVCAAACFHNDRCCGDFVNEFRKLRTAQFFLPERFTLFIDRMCLKHALGDVDPNEMWVCHFRSSCLRADHGATVHIVNRQEGHPIHQLSLLSFL